MDNAAIDAYVDVEHADIPLLNDQETVSRVRHSCWAPRRRNFAVGVASLRWINAESRSRWFGTVRSRVGRTVSEI
jgi:hypothetical protein